MSRDECFCDDCGEQLIRECDVYAIESLPVNVDSANAGESATLCASCAFTVMRKGLDKANAELAAARKAADAMREAALDVKGVRVGTQCEAHAYPHLRACSHCILSDAIAAYDAARGQDGARPCSSTRTTARACARRT